MEAVKQSNNGGKLLSDCEKKGEEVGLHHTLPIEEIRFEPDKTSAIFSLEEHDYPVPCTEMLEDEGDFCLIMICPAHRCPGYDNCPGSQHVYNSYLQYHTPIPCPDCRGGELRGWIVGKCERCYDYGVIAFEERFACDICEYWRLRDHCELLNIGKRERPRECKHLLLMEKLPGLRGMV